MNKWMLSLVSVTLLALAMSGCGGSDGSAGVTSDGGAQTPTPTPETPVSTTVRDLSDTPDQFGDTLPAVPVIPDLAE